jgi:hypothetical protein
VSDRSEAGAECCRCDRCNGEMRQASEWSAEDPTRGWQRITRYICRNCGNVEVDIVARDDLEVRSA